jgi:hypothetical protein
VYAYLSQALVGLKFSAHTALIKMGYSIIKIFNSRRVLQELTKDQKSIIAHLELKAPYEEEQNDLVKR